MNTRESIILLLDKCYPYCGVHFTLDPDGDIWVWTVEFNRTQIHKEMCFKTVENMCIYLTGIENALAFGYLQQEA